MEQFHQIEKSVEQMEYCAGFTRRLLDNGNGPEILSMKKMISQQLTTLITTIPKVDVNYSLEFISNVKKFEELSPDFFFGKFRTESTISPKESTPPPTLPPCMPQMNGTKNSSLNGTGSTISTSVTASSPISLPTSMQSSFDGDISTFGKTFSMVPPSLIQPESPTPSMISNQLNVPPVTNMIEYNIQRLASMVENSASSDLTDSIMPNSTTSGSGLFLDDMLNGEQMMNNLQALAKIGDMTNGNTLGMMDSICSTLNQRTSPILHTPSINSTISGNHEGLKLNCFSQFRPPPDSCNALNSSGRAKATPMEIRSKFGALGAARGQFNSPHGFCLGLDEEIIVADTNNHRIEVRSHII
jgi:tripartite motif-containing protein 2/3